MQRNNITLVASICGGLGGVAAFLQWLGIKPQDLSGWRIPLTIPHWFWLIASLLLFAVSSGLSVYSFMSARKETVARASAEEECVKLRAERGGILDGIKHSEPPSTRLKITHAVYGAGGQSDVDVTEKLRTMVHDALFIPVDNNLVSSDPAIGTRKRLQVEYSYGNGIVESAVRPESTPYEFVSLTLPEDTEIKKMRLIAWQQSQRAQQAAKKPAPQTSSSQEESLRDRIFSECGELRNLLKKHGQRPNAYAIPINDKQEFTRIYNETVQAWDNKFQADYWRNHKDKVVNLRHDLALESLTSDVLDSSIMEADTAALSDETINKIDTGLRALAANLQ